jgi:hypothetical protein
MAVYKDGAVLSGGDINGDMLQKSVASKFARMPCLSEKEK